MSAPRRGPVETLLALAVLVLAVVPLGISAYVLGFALGDSPCILCWGQRLGMALIALVGLFILRFGPRPRYVGLGVLIAAFGLYMAARHSGLHLARDIGQGFSVELLGAHTYSWSALIYWVAVVMMGVLLLLLRDGELASAAPRPLGALGNAAAVAFLVAIAGNVLQAFAGAGPPPYVGPGDPIRFSFDPRHWEWSFDEYKGPGPSWRGRWAIPKPTLEGLASDPAEGPLAALPELAVRRRTRIAPALAGAVEDLAFDATSGRFLAVTAEHGVYLLDRDLARVERGAVVDPAFSVDLGRGFVGAAFVPSGQLMALAENKSYVLLAASDRADGARNFKFFLSGADQFEEVTRGRFATVRARLMYVHSLAFDATRDALYSVAVPSAKQPKLVVSRFERRDLTLGEEFEPALAPESGLRLAGEGRALGEYVVSGLAAADGKLYALSARFGTLLTLDPARRSVTAAHGIPGLDRPSGLAAVGEELWIAQRNGEVLVVARP